MTPHMQCKLCSSKTTSAHYKLHNTLLFACPNCDFHFIDYLDTAEKAESNLTEKGRQYIALRQNENHFTNIERLNFLEQSHPLEGQKLLDVGAGIGRFVKLAHEEYGCQAIGLEPSSLRRQYAQENFALQLKKNYLEEPFWQDQYESHFDIITLWDVIEHVNDPVVTLKDAVKLLKPGGHIAIGTPNRSVLSYRLSEKIYRLSRGRCTLFLDSFYSATPYGHKQIFTIPQLNLLVTNCKLHTIHCQYHYIIPSRRQNKIILLAQKPTSDDSLV